jgi:phosphatidyl-myo-inositol dimannoside synthase
MKLLVTLDFPPETGGIQRYLYGIVRHKYDGSDMVVVGCGRKPRKKIAGLASRISFFTTPLSRFNKKFSCIPILFYIIKTVLIGKKYETIECGNVYAALPAWLLSLFHGGIRYSVFTYGTELACLEKKTFKNFILAEILRNAYRLNALGQYTSGLLVNAGIDKGVIAVIHPRIELPKKTCDFDWHHRSAADVTRILTVGRLVPHKGHAVLIDAISRLPSVLSWKCVIAGNGPMLDCINKMITEKGISEKVEIKNGLSDDDLSCEYENAGIFVLPSLIDRGVEGFGIVLLEAMAHFIPVIASSSGGIAEVLNNGECGLLVEPGNAQELSSAIKILISDTDLRKEIAVKAYERVRKFYAW